MSNIGTGGVINMLGVTTLNMSLTVLDNNFFAHLLIEGLVEYVKVFGAWQPEIAEKVRVELARHLEFLQKYIRDENDGM